MQIPPWIITLLFFLLWRHEYPQFKVVQRVLGQNLKNVTKIPSNSSLEQVKTGWKSLTTPRWALNTFCWRLPTLQWIIYGRKALVKGFPDKALLSSEHSPLFLLFWVHSPVHSQGIITAITFLVCSQNIHLDRLGTLKRVQLLCPDLQRSQPHSSSSDAINKRIQKR